MTAGAADPGPLPADIKGRRAVVTGAGRGIGLAIAHRLIMAEARVVAVDHDKEALERAFNGAPGCHWMTEDLARPDVATLAEEILEDGPVELIVNNLGISTEHGFLDLQEPEFDLVLLSDAWSGYVTGANIPVDGGLSLFSWSQRPND